MPRLFRVSVRAASYWLGAVLTALALTGCTDDPDPSSRPESSAGRTATGRAAPASEDPTNPTAETAAGPPRPRTARQAAGQLAAAEAAIADRSTRPKELVRAARAQQLAYRELGAHPAWDEKVLAGLPRIAARRGARQRRLPPGVPGHAQRARRHAAGLADRATGAGGGPAALLQARRGRLRHRLGVPRRDQPRRDRDGPDPRYVGRRRAGPDAVPPLDVGQVGPRRHPGPGRLDHGRRPLPRPRRRRAAAHAWTTRCSATTTRSTTSGA